MATRSSRLKFGSSKSFSCGSESTITTVPLRWVTRLRALRFTTYPVSVTARVTAASAAGLT